jgi:predicted transglutaminase-like cysteine proteinase
LETKSGITASEDTSILSRDPFCLGSLLLDGKYIDVRQRDESLEIHKKKDLLHGECLIKMGAVTRDILSKVLTFQGRIRESIHKARINIRLELGNLLVTTEMITIGELKKAIRLQRSSKKLLGEILVEIGSISRNILNLALNVQKKLLVLTVFTLLIGPLAGCLTLSPGHYDHTGTSTKVTPYDKRYKKVRKYLETASKFKYKSDGVGADYWQLPLETERLGTGDCDDKAIWLYSKLFKEGFEDIRLVLGNYRRSRSSFHMWVNWYHNGKVFILDPTDNDGIWRADEYPKDFYEPSYSFYKDKSWKHGP